MVHINNEGGKFVHGQEIGDIAPKITMTSNQLGRHRKCVLWIFRWLCIIFILFTGYKLYTTFILAKDGQAPPPSVVNTVNETQAIVNTIHQENALISIQNRQIATEFLDGVQNMLKKRVEDRVKEISLLILEKVQDIENNLAIFERSISTTVDGNLDFTKEKLAKIKSMVDPPSNVNTTSTLEDAINQVENEITKFTVDLDHMYSFYGRYINDILHHKTENITARIRMMLVTDRKLCRNLAPQRVALCYKISRQNYEVTGNLEKVLEATNKLQDVNDALNTFSSTLKPGHLTDEILTALKSTLNQTQQAFEAMLSTDDNFLGTVLKKMAYEKHLEMKDFIYRSYETAIRSLTPALEKVSHDFIVVKDSHFQRIINVLNTVIEDVGKFIASKVSLITDGMRRKDAAKNCEFKSMYTLLEYKFKNASSTVNPLFKTKQDQMTEGLAVSLEFTLNEQLPLVATWSLLDYLPVEACPMSIDFQTYLKSTMELRLMLKNSHQTVSATYKQVLEIDAKFDPARISEIKQEDKSIKKQTSEDDDEIGPENNKEVKRKDTVEKEQKLKGDVGELDHADGNNAKKGGGVKKEQAVILEDDSKFSSANRGKNT